MKIVYLYTSLTTVGGADRIVIQKANYLADVMGHEVYVITDSQAGRAVIFPLSPKVKHIDLDINFDRQYRHGLLLRSLCYFMLMFVYRKKLGRLLEHIKADIVISTLGRDIDFLTQLNDGSRKVGEAHTTRMNLRKTTFGASFFNCLFAKSIPRSVSNIPSKSTSPSPIAKC